MDPLDPARFALSARRSSARCRSLIILLKHGPMHANELARALEIDATRLRWVLHGQPPHYRRERAPITLGLVVMAHTRDGIMYVLTPTGVKEARGLARRAPERWGRRG